MITRRAFAKALAAAVTLPSLAWAGAKVPEAPRALAAPTSNWRPLTPDDKVTAELSEASRILRDVMASAQGPGPNYRHRIPAPLRYIEFSATVPGPS